MMDIVCAKGKGGGGVHNWHSTRKHGAINLGSHLTFQDKYHKMIVTFRVLKHVYFKIIQEYMLNIP